MKKLQNTHQNFVSGQLSKSEYINEMYDNFHDKLFDYALWLKRTNVERIEISDDKVIMTSRDNGIKIVCPKHDKRVAPIEILNFDHYELTDSDMIMKLVKPGDCVLDIGANMGWYALNLGKTQPNTKIHAFEPLPSTYATLNENVKINNLNNITTYNYGFSSKEEDIDFFFYPEGSGNASSQNLSDRKDAQKITCHVKKLDESIEQIGISKVDFIKCDVEGAELFVFQGAIKLLEKDKPIVFTEMLRKWSAKFNYHPNKIIELFHELGYQCFIANNDKSLQPFYLMDDQTQETNFLFLHKDQHAEEITLLSKR